MKKIFTFIFILLFLSCEKQYFLDDRPPVVKLEPTELDLLFENGVTLTLEQVYAHVKINGINQPVDSLFKLNDITGNVGIYGSIRNDTILYNLVRGENWVFDRTIHGLYQKTEYMVVETRVTPLTRVNNFITEHLNTQYLDDTNIYAEYKPKMRFYTSKHRETNFIVEKMFHENNSLVFMTNKRHVIGYEVFPPLTSEQVKYERKRGNYEEFLVDGVVYYKIGNNLYLPRYNHYVYAGSTFDVGYINSLTQTYYEFKFTIEE